MKITTFLLFSCAFLSISACQNTTVVHKPITSTVLSSQKFSEILQQYTWTYTPPNSKTPIQINFNHDGITIYSGCNLMSRKYKTQNHQIILFDDLLSSTKACEELEKQENFSYGLFLQPNSFTLEQNSMGEMVLNLEHSNHQHYIFKATPKKEDLEQSDLELLNQYTWTYTPPNSTVPILVNISPQGTYIYSGCNQISKQHELNGNHLQAKSVQIQTLMGCGDLQNQENLASKFFNDAYLTIFTTEQQTKQLKVTLKDATNYNFQAIPYISDLKNYDAELLNKFTWQQISEEMNHEKIQPLLINFTTNHLLFYAGCNRMSMQYQIENHQIIPKADFRSQVKFCKNYQHERQVAQNTSKPMNIKFDYSTTFPTLILESKYQPQMIFQAIPRQEDLKLP